MIDHCFTILVWFVKHPHELTIGMHVSPHSWISLPHPIHPDFSRFLQSSSLSSLRHTANSHWLSIYKCWCTCIHAALSIHLTLSLLFPTLVCKSVLYVCISVAAMWTDSSDPSFLIPCFSLSDWLACLICSRFSPFIAPSLEWTQMCSFLWLHFIQALISP